MEHNSRVSIYKGMIQYLLDSTQFSLKSIANFSNSSIKTIRSIYRDNEMPQNFTTELDLANLYLIILEANLSKPKAFKYVSALSSNKPRSLIALNEDEDIGVIE